MTRLAVFLSVLTGLILILFLYTFKILPVSNEKFDLQKTEIAYKAHAAKVLEVTAPKEVEGAAEVVEVEYAPVVDLNTPQLVKGNKIFGQCIACHGKGGEGKASQKAPHIGGQYDWYIEKQLTDMKSGARINVAMNPILKGLSPEDMKDVAAYVTLLPWSKEKYLATQAAAVKK
ncbi:MAG: c-type cytochrome [Bacteriovorax sp.]|nr:c-type cytochrome [Bacteriovorax sp.]